MQKLLLEGQRAEMLRNGATNAQRPEEPIDFKPVVKLFVPWGAATWLLTELETDDGEDIAFGLCDLGMGFPELGRVSLTEIRQLRGPGGLYVERDIHFRADKTLSQYAADARAKERIDA